MQAGLFVFRHEMRKIFQDKKILVSIFLLPVLIVYITSFLSTSVTAAKKSHIYALGNALDKLESAQYEIIPVEQQTIEELAETTVIYPEDVVVHVQPGFTNIYYHSLNSSSAGSASACKDLLLDHYLVSSALIHEDEISQSITVADVSPGNNTSGQLMAMILPYMLILLLFSSTSEYSVDTIAGEKENGVFSTLLLTPHKPGQIILGKLIACNVYGIVSTAAYFLVIYVMSFITGRNSPDIRSVDLNAVTVLFFVLASVLLSFLFSTLAILCSLHSVNRREARSLRLPVYAVTLILAFAAFVISDNVPDIFCLIPVYNVSCVMKSMLSSGADPVQILLTLLSLSVCSLIAFSLCIISLRNEEIRC